MPKYRVNLVRIDSFFIEVEAEDEDAALDEALAEAPRLGAVESGWGRKWSIDDGEWTPLDEWHGADYDPKAHGQTVELVEEA